MKEAVRHLANQLGFEILRIPSAGELVHPNAAFAPWATDADFQRTYAAIKGNTLVCHIDVDVYQSAEDVLAWVWPKMPVGGIVVYDDYGFTECPGIVEHVDKQRSLGDRVVIHNLNGHAVVVKTATGSSAPSR